MGALFDLIRISRKIIKHANFLVQAEDLIYWIICALVGFYMLYINNYAAIRPFVFIGILLGALLYFASFSIIFMKIATAVIHYVRALIKHLIRFLGIPAKWLIRLIKIPLKYFYTKYDQVHNYKKRKLRKLSRKWYYIKSEARTDFKVMKNRK
ncbi:MAG: Spore cortex biosynthesis protein YabQ-like protein [Clostridia bacterium]|jgi:spore cortex biosynthesis protein YabQ|nr:Spore cortex biosynthesis protein YabQ-like protein [Clostridia bacterium]